MARRLATGICSLRQRRAQRVAALVAAGEAEQFVLDLVERAFRSCDLEQCPCVALDACVAHRVLPPLGNLGEPERFLQTMYIVFFLGRYGPWSETRIRLYRALETEDEYFPYSKKILRRKGFGISTASGYPMHHSKRSTTRTPNDLSLAYQRRLPNGIWLIRSPRMVRALTPKYRRRQGTRLKKVDRQSARSHMSRVCTMFLPSVIDSSVGVSPIHLKVMNLCKLLVLRRLLASMDWPLT